MLFPQRFEGSEGLFVIFADEGPVPDKPGGSPHRSRRVEVIDNVNRDPCFAKRSDYRSVPWMTHPKDDGAGNLSLHRQYVYGLNYVDEPVAYFDAAGTTPHFILQDANYDVVGVTSDQGVLEQQYTLSPYGQYLYIEVIALCSQPVVCATATAVVSCMSRVSAQPAFSTAALRICLCLRPK